MSSKIIGVVAFTCRSLAEEVGRERDLASLRRGLLEANAILSAILEPVLELKDAADEADRKVALLGKRPKGPLGPRLNRSGRRGKRSRVAPSPMGEVEARSG